MRPPTRIPTAQSVTMHNMDLPAGTRVRLNATAGTAVARRRWDIRVLSAGAENGSARLVFGSEIGDHDRDQRVDIPPQDVDCQLEVRARHAAPGGWEDDRCTVQEDTPNELRLGFCDPSRPGSLADDVLLSFAIAPNSHQSDEETANGQGSETI